MPRILVVDDSLFQRNQVKRILQEGGFETFEAKHGQEALEILKEDTPDLICLDLLMPELDGFGVLENLQTSNNTIPVVVLTADIQETQKQKCLELGAKGFLNKPAKPQELNQVIHDLLQENAFSSSPQSRELNSFESDALKEMINIGVGKAASVLNDMLNTHVDLQVPQIQLYDTEGIHDYIAAAPSSSYSSVKLGFEGAFQGSASLVFVSENASRLVSLLTGEGQEDAQMDSLMAATLTEVGNIVINGVMGSIANIVNGTFLYTVPEYTKGDFHQIVKGTCCNQSAWFVVADTSFLIQEHEIHGEMVLFFELEAFQGLLKALD